MNRGRRNGGFGKKNGQEYWQSYSDMMAALLLMFVLIMASTIFRSLADFEQKNRELDDANNALVSAQLELDAKKAELEAERAELEVISHRLAETQTQLQQVIGVKKEIIEALSGEFSDSMLSVTVDEGTGAITFDSSILFGVDQYVLSERGEQFLQEFIPLYFSVLLRDDYVQYISEIIIEGHTDTSGNYYYNLDLSQRRAYSVATYCLNAAGSQLSESHAALLRVLLTANGKSFSDPVYNDDGTVNMAASRRVAIKFRLKDEEMIAMMQEILTKTQS